MRVSLFKYAQYLSFKGRIFAHVYGGGVKWKHKGIYILSKSQQNWIPLLIGDAGKDFSVSKDGCKIAYGGNYSDYFDICSDTGEIQD